MRGLLTLGLAALLLVLPGAASAAVVQVNGGVTLAYLAAVGEGNSPNFSQAGSQIVVDDVADLTPGPGCAQGVDAQQVVCPAAGIVSVAVLCGDGNDGVTMGLDLPTSMRGGPGDDTLRGGPGNDTMDGDEGPDTINGGGGEDTVSYASHTSPVVADIDNDAGDDGSLEDDDGFGSRDTIDQEVENLIGGSAGDSLTGDANANNLTGGAGPDTLAGGAGPDTADFRDHAGDVVVDIGGGANDGNASDGPASARDNVGADMENISSGAGNDTLAGNGAGNVLSAGAGNDTLKGLAGADVIGGGDGSDTADYSDHTAGVTVDIEGGPNDGNSADGPPGARDELRFDVENLRGGSGGDTLKGNAGGNAIDGGPGDDTLDGAAGPDSLGGGDGTDRVAYESRAGDVEVTMDGVPGDGEPGEGDNVGADVENVGTGAGADTVTGNAAANDLASAGGEDYLDGATGGDKFASGDARDTVRARDGAADAVACGPGVDFAIADPADSVSADCERVDRGVRNTPRLGREVVAQPRGTIRLGLPGVARTVPLLDKVNLPVNTRLDATDKAVQITSSPGGRGRKYTGTFSLGAFKISQARQRNSVTQLTLTGGDFSSCGAARAAQSSRRRTVRRLFASARGRFRTKGRYSSATVRGTKFEVIDRCDGTLTKVTSGTVTVRDQVRRKTVILRRGQRYLARPRG